jgi:hypothetical protein
MVSSAHWVTEVNGVDYRAKIAGRENDLDFVAKTLAPIFQSFTAVGDTPVPALYRPLSANYPNAKFFAFYRPPETWVKSVRQHFGTRVFDPFERVVYWRYFNQKPPAIAEISDVDLLRFQQWHYDEITAFFRSTYDFLILSLDDTGLGQRLCLFCGIPPMPLRVVDYRLGHDKTKDPAHISARFCE